MGWVAAGLLAVAVAVVWHRFSRLRGALRARQTQLVVARSLLANSNVPREQLGVLVEWEIEDVELLGQHNTDAGFIDGRGLCPCRRYYTVATNQFPINAWPNPGAIVQCNQNLPAVATPGDPCPGDCVWVLTHLWYGWAAYRNKKTGAMVFNCETFGQYHCKKPDDPDRDKPPKPYNPRNPPPE